MGYFPAFIKLEGEKILIVGGGKIAADKVSHLLDFTDKISIVAREISDPMQELVRRHHLPLETRAYQEGDIDGFGIVIVAVDDLALQEAIYREARKKKILCNSVDSLDFCDFIFPSYIKKEDLVIAFSTSGASPALSKYLRRAVEKLLPPRIIDFLKQMRTLRESLPKGKERQKLLDQKAREFVEDHFGRF